ncbi:alpha/beta fold hydrolase [Fodinibius salsisoli]|uniref:Alpha/beta hydrolase n=1 Tax=Fodinibius salsisoli TaxID=2820877 RepID=A0ABT3PMN4_9BACT|nr:alpha/beta hydrolase [Fodinibius salsisoli]MCW9707208.1 alpha/beta hydrolase [Fodinibius salsisoli]
MTDCDIIAFHGWGFGPRCWKSWEKGLSNFGTFQSYNRGYFGSSNGEIPLPSTDRKTVLIAHSFGLHWIDETLLERANLLVILGGFLQFHPVAAQYKRRSRTILKQMRKQFEAYPEKVLSNFYADCYAPQEVENDEIGELNHQLLSEDLEWLDESFVAAKQLKNVNKICIIHGSDDHIVPKSKGRELFNQLPQNARYFEIKKAGHAIPITHHTQCLEFIYPEIELLKNKVDQL